MPRAPVWGCDALFNTRIPVAAVGERDARTRVPSPDLTTGVTPNRLATITVVMRWGQDKGKGWVQGMSTDQTLRS